MASVLNPAAATHAARAGQSTNEHRFVLRALNALSVAGASAGSAEDTARSRAAPALRADGRQPLDLRAIRITFGRRHGRAFAEVQLGRTRVRAAITSEIVAPFPDRPVEGFLTFNMDAAQLLENSGGRNGGGAFGGGNTGAGAGGGAGGASADDAAARRALYLTKVVESGIREARAIDTEALCIVAGEKAWSIHCELHVLDDGGNLTDAASLAAIAALRHFRRPEVTVADGKVVEHPLEERVPVPLSVHHTPLSLTFAFLGGDSGGGVGGTAASASSGSGASGGPTAAAAAAAAVAESGGGVLVVDPTHREEYVARGSMTVIMNLHGELCGVHKAGAPGITARRLMHTVKQAKVKIMALSELLREQLHDADEKAKQALIVHANKQRAPVAATLMANARLPRTNVHGGDRAAADDGDVGAEGGDGAGGGSGGNKNNKRRRVGGAETDQKEARMFEQGVVAETSGKGVGWNTTESGRDGQVSRGAALTVEEQHHEEEEDEDDGEGNAELSAESAEFGAMVSKLRQRGGSGDGGDGGAHLAAAVSSAAQAMGHLGGASGTGLSSALSGSAKKRADKKTKKKTKEKKSKK